MGKKRKPKSGPMGPLEQYYVDEIEPLVDRVMALCKERGIDYLINVALDDTGDQYLVAGHVHIVRDGLANMVLAAAILSGKVGLHLFDGAGPEDALGSLPRPGGEPETEYIQ